MRDSRIFYELQVTRISNRSKVFNIILWYMRVARDREKCNKSQEKHAESGNQINNIMVDIEALP